MKCENCNLVHDGTYGSGRFCTTKCARGYSTKVKREQINRKVSKKLQGRKKNKNSHIFTDEDRKKAIESSRSSAKIRKEIRLKTLKFEDFSGNERREYIFREQNKQCAICTNSEWNSKPIPLEMDHISGDNTDNSKKNLRLICPNCHAQTKTYRGKNINSQKKPENFILEEDYVHALQTNKNIRQALISLGLKPEGSNYKRAKKIIEKFNIKINGKI